MPCDLRAGFEIHQFELLAQIDVIQRFEVELWHRRFPATNFQVRLVVRSDRSIGVSHIRNRSLDRVHFRSDCVQLHLAAVVCSRRSPPWVLRASRSSASLALPIDLETSFAWRFRSSTKVCLSRRKASSETKRATSACAPRRRQFSATWSAFSMMNLRSSIRTPFRQNAERVVHA